MAPALTVSLAETPLTGEPYAGNPPVRFGGRGGANPAIPTPNQLHGVLAVEPVQFAPVAAGASNGAGSASPLVKTSRVSPTFNRRCTGENGL